MKGTTTGIADVYLDGVKKATVNLGATTASYQVDVWSTGTVADGPHFVDIVRDAASASGKYLTLDSFDVSGTIDPPPPAPTRYQDSGPGITYTGPWSIGTTTLASGGGVHLLNSAGSARLTFTGTYVAWISAKAATYGKATVKVDGAAVATVDHSLTTKWQQNVWSTTLPSGPHTVEILWTGTKYSAATSTYIGIDAFDVVGTVSEL